MYEYHIIVLEYLCIDKLILIKKNTTKETLFKCLFRPYTPVSEFFKRWLSCSWYSDHVLLVNCNAIIICTMLMIPSCFAAIREIGLNDVKSPLAYNATLYTRFTLQPIPGTFTGSFCLTYVLSFPCFPTKFELVVNYMSSS